MDNRNDKELSCGCCVTCRHKHTPRDDKESAMQSFGYLILQEHMKTCMTEEIQSGNIEVVDEVLELMKKLK